MKREDVLEHLQAKKQKLKDRLALMETVEQNIAFVRDGGNYPQRFRNIQRLGIPFDDLRIAWYRGVQSDYEAKSAISTLAENGDPLARELVRAFTAEYGGRTFLNRLVQGTESSRVVQGLIFRRLTEKRYWDYVVGKEPVGYDYKGNPIHLQGVRG